MAVHFSGRVSIQLDKVSRWIEGGGAREIHAAVREHCLDETVNTSTPSSCARPRPRPHRRRRRPPRRCPGRARETPSARIFRPPTPNNSDHPETDQRYHTNRRTIKYRFPATNHRPPASVSLMYDLHGADTCASTRDLRSPKIINIRGEGKVVGFWKSGDFEITTEMKRIRWI